MTDERRTAEVLLFGAATMLCAALLFAGLYLRLRAPGWAVGAGWPFMAGGAGVLVVAALARRRWLALPAWPLLVVAFVRTDAGMARVWLVVLMVLVGVGVGAGRGTGTSTGTGRWFSAVWAVIFCVAGGAGGM